MSTRSKTEPMKLVAIVAHGVVDPMHNPVNIHLDGLFFCHVAFQSWVACNPCVNCKRLLGDLAQLVYQEQD